MYITVQDVYKYFSYGKNRAAALENVTLDIARGEFVCLLGPSGCGKTTLLNLLAGFEQPSSGRISIAGEAVRGPSPRYVTVFQNASLLPWRNVRKNIELGLEALTLTRNERRRRAEEYLELVGLTRFAGHYPAQLSGGMQQRVSIARALAVDPEIIFMDEPFGALDAITRMNMQDEIISIWEKKHKTIVFVTHDIEESVFLADRIVIMTPYPGKIKSLLRVPLPRRRDRIGGEFLHIRNQVFKELEMAPAPKTEYYI